MAKELEQLLYEGVQNPSAGVIQDRLNRLIRALMSPQDNLSTDDIENVSTVNGATVTDALNELLTIIGGLTGIALFNLVAVVDPTVNDDTNAGYTTNQSIWFNTTTQTFWACQDDTAGAAVWTAQGTASAFVGTVSAVQAALPTLAVGSRVFITDADSTNGGALFNVIKDADGNTALSPDGTGFFLNADLYGNGDYSGVQFLTGVAPGTPTGVWYKLEGDINYAPEVTTFFHGISGVNFAVGNTLTGNNSGTSEILSIGNQISITIPDTTGMQPNDIFVIKDIGTATLQTGTIDSIVSGTVILVSSLSGGYFDAFGFDNYDNTTQAITGSISDIDWQMNIKVTSGDWSVQSSFINDVAPNDTANQTGIFSNNFLNGQNVTNNTTGSVGVIINNTGNGSSVATLSVRFNTGAWNDGDTLYGDTGQVAFEQGTVTYTHTFITGDFSVDNNDNYQCIDDTLQDGSSPSNNPAAWQLLLRTDTDQGYILKADKILGYDLANDFWKMRWDMENETIINHWSRNTHQWGDQNIRIKMVDGSTFLNTLNNRNELRFPVDCSHSSIYMNDNEGVTVGKISGGWQYISAYRRGSNSYLTLDVTGADAYISVENVTEGNDVINISGESRSVYGYSCTTYRDRIITAGGSYGYDDYNTSSGERNINSNGDNCISESYNNTGSCYLQIHGASAGYYGNGGIGDVAYYLDNASSVYAGDNTGAISGRIADGSFADYNTNAGTIEHDNVSGGFTGTLKLDFGFTRRQNKLSAKDQYYTLPSNVDYVDGEELTPTYSSFEVELDAQANYTPDGTPTGLLTIPDGMQHAGFFKFTSMVRGTMVVANETNPFTPGNSLVVFDGAGGTGNIIAVGVNILAYNAIAHTITFEALCIGSLGGSPLSPTDVFLTGALSVSDGTETADFVSCAGGLITTVNGFTPTHPCVFYPDEALVNNVYSDTIWGSSYGAIFSDGGATPNVLVGRASKTMSDKITLEFDGSGNSVIQPSPSILS